MNKNPDKSVMIFNDFTIGVLDVGAKFGIHPSFRKIRPLAKYYLVDADLEETEYLKKIYSNSENISVFNEFMDSEEKNVEFFHYSHPGGHSAFKPDNNQMYWSKLRPGTSDILNSVNIHSTTLDNFSLKNKISTDFLKIDVEGKEPEVLKGGKFILSRVLGVRCEVLLNSLYENCEPSFNLIDSLLRENGFIFLGFDNEASNSRVAFSDIYTEKVYGQLIGLDGLWIKPPEEIISKSQFDSICKYAIFCLLNSAQDLAVYVLQEFCKKNGTLNDQLNKLGSLNNLASPNKIIDFIEREIASILFSLRDRPRYSTNYLAGIFETIFSKPWVKPGEYFRRYPLD